MPNFLKTIRSIKVKTWKQLEKVSKLVEIEGIPTLLVPMGVHGLERSKCIIDSEDEIKKDMEWFEEHKFDKTGTIILIGTGS